jgi:hypothetical protein
MSSKFYLCWCPKLLLIDLCLFGDVSNALEQWVNSHAQFITIWRTWIEFTLLAKVYFMGIRIKHCSLMMSLTRPFKIQNETAFSLSHLKDMSYPKKGTMVRPCISIVINVKGFGLCKDNLCPFFAIIMQFLKLLFSSWYSFYFWFK